MMHKEKEVAFFGWFPSDDGMCGTVSSVRARGNVKRKLGNYKDALRDLNRADCLSPHSSWILGYVVKALGISSVNFMLAD